MRKRLGAISCLNEAAHVRQEMSTFLIVRKEDSMGGDEGRSQIKAGKEKMVFKASIVAF